MSLICEDKQRLEAAVEAADLAFWGVIAEAYPEVKTGELTPDVALPFWRNQAKVVEVWLKLNAPKGDTK